MDGIYNKINIMNYISNSINVLAVSGIGCLPNGVKFAYSGSNGLGLGFISTN